MRRRFFCLALALCLCLTPALAAEEDLFPAVQAMGSFTDVGPQGPGPGEAWYDYDSVKVCVETGLMKGDGDAFRPGGDITIAEVAVISARMASRIYDQPIPQGANWYDGHIALLKQQLQETCDFFNKSTMGLVGVEGMTEADLAGLMMDPRTECPALYKDPLSPATREDFVYLLTRGAALVGDLNHIDRLPDTRDPVVLNFYNAGIVTGTDPYYGNFDGDRGLSRAEAAAMVARIARPALRKELYFLVPEVEQSPAQAAWQADRPVGLDGQGMTALVRLLNQSTGLSAAADKYWLCHDMGLGSESVLLSLEGDGAVTAYFLLPMLARHSNAYLELMQESKGFSDEDFWGSVYHGDGGDLPIRDFLKQDLKDTVANLLLRLRDVDDPTDEQIAALADRFQESPDFQALDPRVLYELARTDYYAALYSADDWKDMMGE